MENRFELKSVEYDHPVRFSTPGKYSMETVLELLGELEDNYDCEISIENWKSKGNGFIVEKEVPVFFENMEFTIMCSYEDFFLKRVSGNKSKFFELCETIKELGCGNA